MMLSVMKSMMFMSDMLEFIWCHLLNGFGCIGLGILLFMYLHIAYVDFYHFSLTICHSVLNLTLI